MKNNRFMYVVASFIVGMVLMFSCQKEEVANGEQDMMLKAGQIDPQMTLVAVPNPTFVGEEITVTGTVYADCGKVRLQEWLQDPSTLIWGWAPGVEDGSGFIDVTSSPFVITKIFIGELGTHTFRLQYIGSGAGCEYGTSFSPSLDVVVNQVECEGRLSIAPELVKEEVLGNGNYRFTVQYHVKACEDFTNVKTQGGLIAGCTNVVTDGLMKITKQNTIINWTEPTMPASTNKTYQVIYERKFKGAGVTYDITGAWSAKGWDVNGIEVIAGYNNKLQYTTPE